MNTLGLMPIQMPSHEMKRVQVGISDPAVLVSQQIWEGLSADGLTFIGGLETRNLWANWVR